LRSVKRPTPGLGILLVASTAYLLALLCGYVFGIGDVRRHHVESAAYIFGVLVLGTAWLRRLREEESPDPEKNHGLWLISGFLAAGMLLYGDTMSLGLFSDDFVLVRRALSGDWLSHEEFVRPFPLVLWGVLLKVTSHPAALHLLNIVLHGMNAALVSLLSLRVGLPRPSTLGAGLLFLVFPSSVETVVWPSAVPDLLVALSSLLVLLLAAQASNTSRLVVAAFALAVGLLSKESAVVIPLLVALMWLPAGDPRRSPAWPILLVGFGVCALYIAIRTTLVAIPDSYVQPPSRYLVKEFVARPYGTLTMPWAASVVSARPAIPFAWAAGCVLALASSAWTSKRGIPLTTGLRCVFAVLVVILPLYSILYITPDLENGRYLYLSTAFWVIALVGFISTAGGLDRIRLIALSLALVLGVAGVRWHLAPWWEASRIRDTVLESAERILLSTPCRPVSFGGAPDSVRGAYLFRNGLEEAITFRIGAVPSDHAGDCTFVWDGAEFRRTTSPSVPVQATFAR
jgi:hypothetical protein